jgi:hypothetical protein
MAIQISERRTSNIGYTGTIGGRASWINESQTVGRAAANLGDTIVKSAKQLYDAFDTSLTVAEKNQEINQLTSNYTKSSKHWSNTLKNGGFNPDENGVMTQIIKPMDYQKNVEDWHKEWYKDNVLNKNIDLELKSKFDVFFQSKQSEMYGNAGNYARNRRYAVLQSKSAIQLADATRTIFGDGSVKNKEDAFSPVENMYQDMISGLSPHLDPNAFTPQYLKLKSDLIYYSEREKMLGSKSMSNNPEAANGYTSKDYETLIARIPINDKLDAVQKNKLLTEATKKFNSRLKVEKIVKAENLAEVQRNLQLLRSNGDLTEQDIFDAKLPNAEHNAWKRILNNKENPQWKKAFNRIYLKIQSGTLYANEDVSKDPAKVKREVHNLIIQWNIDPKDGGKVLLDLIDETAKESTLTASISYASKYAGKLFGVDNDYMFANGQLTVSSGSNNSDQKLHAFNMELRSLLKAGVSKGDTWLDMLDPASDRYIVGKLIRQIDKNYEKYDPDKVPSNSMSAVQAADDNTIMQNFKDWYYAENTEQDRSFTKENSRFVDIYGVRTQVGIDVDDVQALAHFNATYAMKNLKNPNDRIEWPTDHPAYKINRKETISQWLARKSLISNFIQRYNKK